MSNLRARLADALHKHSEMWSIDGNMQCRCKALMRHDAHAAHLADVLLSLPGIAIVELTFPIGLNYQHFIGGKGVGSDDRRQRSSDSP